MMGCTAGKGNTVVPVVEPQPGQLMSSTEKDITPIESVSPEKTGIESMASTAKGCAFEVRLDDGEEDVIRKHPPKRIQRLEDQQLPPLTKELIIEKQEGAEQRRIELLNKRIQSAKARNQSKRRYLQPIESNELIENLDKELSTVEL